MAHATRRDATIGDGDRDQERGTYDERGGDAELHLQHLRQRQDLTAPDRLERDAQARRAAQVERRQRLLCPVRDRRRIRQVRAGRICEALECFDDPVDRAVREGGVQRGAPRAGERGARLIRKGRIIVFLDHAVDLIERRIFERRERRQERRYSARWHEVRGDAMFAVASTNIFFR